jgi:hypothetical protein
VGQREMILFVCSWCQGNSRGPTTRGSCTRGPLVFIPFSFLPSSSPSLVSLFFSRLLCVAIPGQSLLHLAFLGHITFFDECRISPIAAVRRAVQVAPLLGKKGAGCCIGLGVATAVALDEAAVTVVEVDETALS